MCLPSASACWQPHGTGRVADTVYHVRTPAGIEGIDKHLPEPAGGLGYANGARDMVLVARGEPVPGLPLSGNPNLNALKDTCDYICHEHMS
jgi:hypothetical protein